MGSTKLSAESSLSQQTAQRIIAYMKDNALCPADRLPNEGQLCQMLDVSRGTLREGIKILVSRNILTIKRGVGTFVSSNPGITEDPLGLDFVEDKKGLLLDLMQFRLIIEPALVGMAAENADDSDRRHLSDIELNLERAYSEGRDTAVYDIEFHTQIARCSHNHVVELVFPILTKSIPAVNVYTQKSLMDSTVCDHKAIIQAIEDCNSNLAQAIMTQHLKRNIKYISDKVCIKKGEV